MVAFLVVDARTVALTEGPLLNTRTMKMSELSRYVPVEESSEFGGDLTYKEAYVGEIVDEIQKIVETIDELQTVVQHLNNEIKRLQS